MEHVQTLAGLALAASALAAPACASVALPDFHYARPGDLSSPEAAEVFAQDLTQSTHVYCRAHAEVLTPTSVGNLSVCRRELSRIALRKLPQEQRDAFTRAGGHRALAQANRSFR